MNYLKENSTLVFLCTSFSILNFYSSKKNLKITSKPSPWDIKGRWKGCRVLACMVAEFKGNFSNGCFMIPMGTLYGRFIPARNTFFLKEFLGCSFFNFSLYSFLNVCVWTFMQISKEHLKEYLC